MSLALACLLVLGPPKLPPLPGRSMPAPPETVAPSEPAPSEPAPREPAPREPATQTPVPPPPPAPTTARGPAKPSAIAAPLFPGEKPPTPPPPPPPPATMPAVKTGAATSATGAAAPLRLVSTDEVAGWDAADRRAKAFAPKSTSVPEEPRSDMTLRRTASAEKPDDRLTFRRGPAPPRRSAAFVLGYRFFRVEDPLGRAQDWHLASLEVSPLRRWVRLNLITEFGVEGGPAARAGDRADMLLMERLGLGMQYPGVVTPFFEFQGGVGGARVELFGRNDLALLYALGVDAGAQWAVTRWMYLHAAIGWIRPTFVWPERRSAFDRVAFKVGIGF